MTAPKSINTVRQLAEFRSVFDKSYIVPKKVKDGITKLGRYGWMYEVEFAKHSGVALTDLHAFRDQFANNVVQLKEGRRAWAGSKEAATKMRSML